MTSGTRAERMRQPMALDVAKGAAEQHGVCERPFTMEVEDRATYEVRYVAVPCGSAVESVCAPCARKAKALRMAQCREGWHMGEETDFTPTAPTEDRKELLTFRADLVKAYREAVAAGQVGNADELREESTASTRNFGNSASGVASPHPTHRAGGRLPAAVAAGGASGRGGRGRAGAQRRHARQAAQLGQADAPGLEREGGPAVPHDGEGAPPVRAVGGRARARPAAW
ncbi:hypothetical protein GCM10009660_04190 [Catellatospora bangladeshensis]